MDGCRMFKLGHIDAICLHLGTKKKPYTLSYTCRQLLYYNATMRVSVLLMSQDAFVVLDELDDRISCCNNAQFLN